MNTHQTDPHLRRRIVELETENESLRQALKAFRDGADDPARLFPHEWGLSPAHGVILHGLLTHESALPRQIAGWLYDGRAYGDLPESPEDVVRQHIFQLRRRLRRNRVGFIIAAPGGRQKGSGYMIVPNRKDVLAAIRRRDPKVCFGD